MNDKKHRAGGTPAVGPGEGLLVEGEAAALLGITARTLMSWRHTGDGPPYIRLGTRVIRYRRADVDRWIDAQRPGVAPRAARGTRATETGGGLARPAGGPGREARRRRKK